MYHFIVTSSFDQARGVLRLIPALLLFSKSPTRQQRDANRFVFTATISTTKRESEMKLHSLNQSRYSYTAFAFRRPMSQNVANNYAEPRN